MGEIIIVILVIVFVFPRRWRTLMGERRLWQWCIEVSKRFVGFDLEGYDLAGGASYKGAGGMEPLVGGDEGVLGRLAR